MLTDAPPEFTCTGAEQIPDATEVMDFTTIRNIDHIELLKLFPGKGGNDSLARAVMEASGYTIDNCPENMLHLSYGLEPDTVPLAVQNATTIVELTEALAEMPPSVLEVSSCSAIGLVPQSMWPPGSSATSPFLRVAIKNSILTE